MTETDITRSIRAALTQAGFWVERCNSGKVPTRNGFFSGMSAGTPDTLILAPIYGWLETKTPTGKLRPAQVEWHRKAARHGIRVGVVTSVREAVETAMAWRADRRSA